MLPSALHHDELQHDHLGGLQDEAADVSDDHEHHPDDDDDAKSSKWFGTKSGLDIRVK